MPKQGNLFTMCSSGQRLGFPVIALVVFLLGASVLGSALIAQPPPSQQQPTHVAFADSTPGSTLSVTLWFNHTQVEQGHEVFMKTNASGGTPPYTYSYSNLPVGSGCTNQNSSELNCTPSNTGNYMIQVSVTDSVTPTPDSGMASDSLNVDQDLTISSYSFNPNPVRVNKSVSINVQVSGGVGGSTTFQYTGLPPGCVSANQQTLSCMPTKAGSYDVKVTATDQIGDNATMTKSLNVSKALTISSFTITPGTVIQNAKVTFLVVVSGGTIPYSYQFSGLQGCNLPSEPPFTCNPSQSGNYTVQLTVMDQSGDSISAQSMLNVSAPVMISTISINPDPVTVNNQLSIQVQFSGGTGPYSFKYTDLPSGCSSQNSSSITCTPTQTGSFNVQVTVTDSLGSTATHSQQLTVNSKSGNGGGNSSSNGGGSGSNFSISDILKNFTGSPIVIMIFLVAVTLSLAVVVAIILTAVFTGLTASRTKKILKLLESMKDSSAASPATGQEPSKMAAAPSGVATVSAAAPTPVAPLAVNPPAEAPKPPVPPITATEASPQPPSAPKCASCGRVGEPADRFCQGCGKPL
jgi:hypothetical protein